jgi:hypothetical protein
LDGLKKWNEENPTARKENGIKSSKGKYYGDIKSILDVSKRTSHKILKRIGLGCCICGWNEAPCDIHHINGKKVKDANGHWNLTILCPNHHRMYHNKKIQRSDIKNLIEYFPDDWNKHYHG